MGEGDAGVYRDLPQELIDTLRDPRVVLPGEMEAFGAPYYDGNPRTGTYVQQGKNTVPGSDT